MRCTTLVLTATLLGACSGETRFAPVVSLPDSTVASEPPGSVVVPYPPPPAQVELVPPRPAPSNCVWLDGQWAYNNQEYQWISGAWVQPPAGCAFARSRFFWNEAQTRASQLRYWIGRWVIPEAPFTECPAVTACNQTGP